MCEETAGELVKVEAALSADATEHRCPFYGFFGFGSFLWAQHGNACGLSGSEHRPAPCEPNPDWDNCPRNGGLVGPDFFAAKGDSIMVFPAYEPTGEGVTLNAWFE